MFYRVIEERTFTATYELATEHACLPPVQQDEVITQGGINENVTRIQTGQIRKCKWAVCRCLEDGRMYRLSGGHTSRAILRTIIDLPEEIDIEIVYTVFECDDKRGMIAILLDDLFHGVNNL